MAGDRKANGMRFPGCRVTAAGCRAFISSSKACRSSACGRCVLGSFPVAPVPRNAGVPVSAAIPRPPVSRGRLRHRRGPDVYKRQEKPKPEVAPSSLAVVGRYILSPKIFNLLENTTPGAGGEIQLTDAIATLLLQHPVHAYRFCGTRFDCGTHLGLIEATIRYALSLIHI